MFSRTSVIIIFVVVLLAVNIIGVSVLGERKLPFDTGRIIIAAVSPFQKLVENTTDRLKSVWRHYFLLVSVSTENDRLRDQVRSLENELVASTEVELANDRLRKLLIFKERTNLGMLASSVIAKDPSYLFKTVMIDKGRSSGLSPGLPVVLPEGIVGQIVSVAEKYSKVLLITDGNSAVDALVQRTRARGLVKGSTLEDCRLAYALRKHDIRQGDILISSGLDGVFPKGLRLGFVKEAVKDSSGIFQDVTVSPFVDFERIEEVLVVLTPPKHDFVTSP
jgi:rod shape-determining protein MreC